ncbi:MAG: hypothetical protein AB7V62_14675 [Thermoleophilia bacterium]
MPRRRTALAALAAVTASLAVAGPATADSISYIKNGDVWLATPDGARHFQVTSTGVYSYASQADNGTIIALAGERLHRLDRLGNVTADFATPVSDGPPPPAPPAWNDTRTNYFNGPFEPEISPDGTKVSYTYFWQHYTYDYVLGSWRNRLESGTAITHIDRLTAWSEFGGNLTGWRNGSWVDSDTLMRGNAGVPLAEDLVFNDIAPGSIGEVRRWFRNYGGYDRYDGELNRQASALALSGDGPADEGGRHLGVYRTLGGVTAEPELCFRLFDDAATDNLPPRSSSWSPDGGRLAFQDGAGVQVLNVGDLSGACRTPVDADITMLAAGATQPDWGPADVPAGRPATAGPGGGAGPGATPGAGAKALKAGVARARLGTALRRGIRVRLTAPGRGRAVVVARLRGAVVARGSAPVAAAGRRAVTVRFTAPGRRALARARTARLKLAVTFTPRGGTAVRQSVAVTLKR